MTRKEASELVRRAGERGWVDPASASECLEQCISSAADGDHVSRVDVLMVRRGLLTPDQARELTGLPKPPSIGDCRLVRRLGEGPHGTTILVRHPQSCRLYAVKVLHKKLAADAAYLEKAERVVYAAQTVRGHSVARGWGIGCAQGEYYYSTTYIAGKTLHELIKTGRTFPPRIAVGHLCHVAAGLASAWDRGFWHGNITPANIILAEDGTVKLTGLGLLRVTPKAIDLTGTGFGVFSPRYLSPEHFQALESKSPAIDCRSDIFSLGIILYEMITGRHPFEGRTVEEYSHNATHAAAADPAYIDPSVSAGLSDILVMMLASEPSRRYQSPRELLDDLNGLRTNPLPDVRRVRSRQLRSASPHSEGHRMVVMLIGAVVLLLIAAIVIASLL